MFQDDALNPFESKILFSKRFSCRLSVFDIFLRSNLVYSELCDISDGK